MNVRSNLSTTALLTVAMTVIVLLIECLIYFVTAAERSAATQRDLWWAVNHGSVANPPACSALVVERDGVITGMSRAAPGFPLTGRLEAVRAGAPAITEVVHVEGWAYSVLTTRRGDEVVQVIYDERFHQEEERNLLVAFAIATLLTALATAGVATAAGRRMRKPLAEALSLQRRLVADASHELRAPLTQLHTRAQLLARKSEVLNWPEGVAGDVLKLVSCTRQLGDVVDDILRSGQPSTQVVDLGALADEVVAAEDLRAAEASLTLRVRRGPGVFLVPGAESALRRVITSLVDNAIAHTPPGGEVVVALDAPADGPVRISVRDNGVGFAEADGRLLFERFTCGTSGRGQQFGIGLALVREVVECHRGKVSAHGEPGAGAVFTVELPRASPRRGDAVVSRFPWQTGSRSSSRRPRRPVGTAEVRAANGTARPTAT